MIWCVNINECFKLKETMFVIQKSWGRSRTFWLKFICVDYSWRLRFQCGKNSLQKLQQIFNIKTQKLLKNSPTILFFWASNTQHLSKPSNALEVCFVFVSIKPSKSRHISKKNLPFPPFNLDSTHIDSFILFLFNDLSKKKILSRRLNSIETNLIGSHGAENMKTTNYILTLSSIQMIVGSFTESGWALSC